MYIIVLKYVTNYEYENIFHIKYNDILFFNVFYL